MSVLFLSVFWQTVEVCPNGKKSFLCRRFLNTSTTTYCLLWRKSSKKTWCFRKKERAICFFLLDFNINQVDHFFRMVGVMRCLSSVEWCTKGLKEDYFQWVFQVEVVRNATKVPVER